METADCNKGNQFRFSGKTHQSLSPNKKRGLNVQIAFNFVMSGFLEKKTLIFEPSAIRQTCLFFTISAIRPSIKKCYKKSYFADSRKFIIFST